MGHLPGDSGPRPPPPAPRPPAPEIRSLLRLCRPGGRFERKSPGRAAKRRRYHRRAPRRGRSSQPPPAASTPPGISPAFPEESLTGYWNLTDIRLLGQAGGLAQTHFLAIAQCRQVQTPGYNAHLLSPMGRMPSGRRRRNCGAFWGGVRRASDWAVGRFGLARVGLQARHQGSMAAQRYRSEECWTTARSRRRGRAQHQVERVAGGRQDPPSAWQEAPSPRHPRQRLKRRSAQRPT